MDKPKVKIVPANKFGPAKYALQRVGDNLCLSWVGGFSEKEPLNHGTRQFDSQDEAATEARRLNYEVEAEEEKPGG